MYNLNAKNKVLLKKIYTQITPTQIVILSFLIIILVGTVFLSLPISQTGPAGSVSFLDCLFTSASAVCVTGLVTVTTATSWSLFGQIVLLVLIQIGGLGLVAIITYFGIHLGRKITLRDRLTLQSAFNHTSFHGMAHMVLFVVRSAFLCEGIGAFFLFWGFLKEGYGVSVSIYFGIFHSISAFCNAGFDLIGTQSLIPFASNPLITIPIMLLVSIGGIGFSVWNDIASNIKNFFSSKTKKRWRFSLHTKLVLLTSAILLLAGTFYFFIAEYQNLDLWKGTGENMDKLSKSIFQSVTLRTAGFTTIEQKSLSETSKFISSIFMMIGGSPGSTAGGIKTVTLAVVLCSVWSVMKGRYTIDVFNRNIPLQLLQKALTIITIMIFLLGSGTILLAFTEHNSSYTHLTMDIFYETASALSTAGFTTGLTPFLSSHGKLLLMLFMFIGRIGPISIMISLTRKIEKTNENLRYPQEDILIG